MNREEKDDEEDVAEDSLAEGSHKSPSSKKSNRSDSLNHTPRLNQRISRNNSQSSSLLNTNRMSLVEAGATGPDGLPLRSNVRNSTSGNPTAASSASNTLKRSGTLTRNNQVLRASSALFWFKNVQNGIGNTTYSNVGIQRKFENGVTF